jgi:hypothetical protein
MEKTIFPLLKTRAGLKVKLQMEVAGVIVTRELTLLGTATLTPIVPEKLEVLPAGKGLGTLATMSVKLETIAPAVKMLLRVIWLLTKLQGAVVNGPTELIW